MAVSTDKFIQGLNPAAERYEERDAGCAGLAIRIGVKGEKLWSAVVIHGGKRRRIRLGAYPDVRWRWRGERRPRRRQRRRCTLAAVDA